MKKVLIFMADGCEECEALVTVDILKRAGVGVDMVSVHDKLEITSTHNIKFFVDKKIDDIDNFMQYDMLVLPGGVPGVDNIYECEKAKNAIIEFNDAGKNIAAICAAPSILAKLGVLKNKQATVHPSFKNEMDNVILSINDPVTFSNVTTASGLGHVFEFALQLVDVLGGNDASENIADSIGFNIY